MTSEEDQENARVLPENSKVVAFREEYEDRLRTFTVANYFGIPHLLSPIVCARLGFRNKGQNQLQCVGCHEQLLVQFPACLSATARSKLTSLYEQQLCELHRDSCPFRRDAQNYRLLGNLSDRIPALWTQVWRPKEVLELLDPLRPSAVVRERWEKVIPWLESAAMDCTSWKLPPIDASVFQQFAKTEDEILEKCWKLICGETQDGDEIPTRSHELELGALLVVLMGWTPDTARGMHCSICLAKWTNLGSVSRDDEPQPKRVCLRVNAPVDTHRYYCPFVRGLPHAGMRFCDRILLRLLNETNNQDKELPLAATEFRLEIRKLLKDAISPSKFSAVSK
ncbi:hypothetical protein FisN_6Lh246 [Fistulifera solaris]|uniref:C3HC-type domain-containing protein n=1 Tax=Fistulifera solaris TaxID=1519565 RepID=A0A1Z5J5X4_FISSO|nr:hypothetical protein FisN_6Lh246 [Fistulifera solaris]|eukprot:GAX09380.1 hypothetical protein FisN_6Lh246 [Fistulifera solaris]